jgi:16S rRNA (guanine527-N7)-methyltransferase
MSELAVAEKWNVSRETIDLLKEYEALVKKWNPRINLVSKSNLENLWDRHIVDSLQVVRSAELPDRWVDLGSGGGFPGLVAAIVAKEENPDCHVTLVESDQRKGAFLRTVIRECGLSASVISQRIEKVDPLSAQVLSARALADLSLLFEFAEQHLGAGGICLFPKGATWKKEVESAREKWSFDVDPITSFTNPEAVILKVRGVARV